MIHGLKMLPFVVAFFLFLFSGCGPSENEDPPDNQPPLGRGGDCQVQNDCFDCTGCRMPYREVCLDNLCWLAGDLNEENPEGDPLSGSYLALLELPRGMDPTKFRSAAIRVLHPERVDGSRVACADLLADPAGVDEDDSLNRLRVLQPALILNANDDVAVPSVGNIPTGDERVFFVRLHSQNNGQGRTLGIGCTAGISVDVGMENQRVVIEIIEVE